VEIRISPRHVLFYRYVTENIVERRAPFRAEHIALLRQWTADGRLLMGGALGNPPHGALIVFAGEGPEPAQTFAASDPYVRNAIVTEWRVEPWSVVS
jgi:uncharacterized protein YciI